MSLDGEILDEPPEPSLIGLWIASKLQDNESRTTRRVKILLRNIVEQWYPVKGGSVVCHAEFGLEPVG